MSDLPYDDPVLRANSPDESLSTEYGPDETTQAEKELSTAEYARRVETTHRFHVAREVELFAEQSPLLPPLNQGDEKGEKVRFEQVMLTLRRIVAQVEEELCFDATLTRSSPRGALEEPGSTDDLVTLMQGLMGTEDPSLAHTPSPSRGPISISSSTMILDPPHALRHALPYDRTIGYAAGKGKLWAE